MQYYYMVQGKGNFEIWLNCGMDTKFWYKFELKVNFEIGIIW